MGKYRVIACCSYELKLDVEANDEQEACEIAEETDGGRFRELVGSENWEIIDVTEITEENGPSTT